MKVVFNSGHTIRDNDNLYFGFFHFTGKPFYKSTGKNEIEVLSYEDKANPRCWMYGTEYGNTYPRKTSDLKTQAYVGFNAYYIFNR